MTRKTVVARWIALAMVMTPGCVEESEIDVLEAEEEEELEDEELEERCAYHPTLPPTPDVNVPGLLNDYYVATGAGGPACDLHVWKINTSPPGSRARTVVFDLGSFVSEFDGYVYGQQCGGGFCGPWTRHDATVETGEVCIPGGSIHDPEHCFPVYFGKVTLPVYNAYTELRVAGRNGTRQFEMTISE